MSTNDRLGESHDVQPDESLDTGAITVEDLQGATVYDRHDESVGKVSDVITGADGAIETLVVDVGGILGLARHTVGVGVRQVSIRLGDGDAVRVYLRMTNDELRELPEHGAAGIPPAAGYRT